MDKLLQSALERIHLARRSFRAIRRYSAVFGDPHAADVLTKRMRWLFRKGLKGAREGRRAEAAKEAISTLTYLNKALTGEVKAIKYVEEFAYGRTGPIRHLLLRPHFTDLHEPSFSHPLLKSTLSHPSPSSIKAGPVFPARNEVVAGPLHPNRKKNIVNRWWTHRVLDKLSAPIPEADLASLRSLALGTAVPRMSEEERIRRTGKGPHTRVVTDRFIRRRAARLLDSIPVLVREGPRTRVKTLGLKMEDGNDLSRVSLLHRAVQ